MNMSTALDQAMQAFSASAKKLEAEKRAQEDRSTAQSIVRQLKQLNEKMDLLLSRVKTADENRT
jgi:hypothetical protein